MRLASLLFRIFAWFSMRALEVQLDAQNSAIDACYDMSRYFGMVESREQTKSELAAARARYTATFRPGIRFTFKNA